MDTDSLEQIVRRKIPALWINPLVMQDEQADAGTACTLDDVRDAASLFARMRTLLKRMFPELESTGGVIESDLLEVPNLREAIAPGLPGRWFLKCDHDLPVAGSVKARGGIFEVLAFAEELALRHGLIGPGGDRLALASEGARELFRQYRVVVGSTGNLGLSIGTIASALGFNAVVHMSVDAKAWKKEKLRARGVEVIEHSGDYSAAVAAGRRSAAGDPYTYFVDDENSKRLFLGYSAAALHLKQQCLEQGIGVDANHPLFVYLPCGVGGAPGGICFGLRHLLGKFVHCFFAEPTSSPSMLAALALSEGRPVKVEEFGLDNKTEADGLAVGQASDLVAMLIQSLVSGIFTVNDDDLLEAVYLLDRSENIRVEPSAAAGFYGPGWIAESEQGRRYVQQRNLGDHIENATHILWSTGGSLMPDEDMADFIARGRKLVLNKRRVSAVSGR